MGVILSFCIFIFVVFFCIFLSFSVFLSFCLFVFLSFCIVIFFVFLSFCTVWYSTVQHSNRRGGWCQGVAHSIFHSMCGVSVTGAASLVAECGTNILFPKMLKITFLNPLFGALPKIGYWIRKYVQIRHGFPFLKWCETSQSVQRFECWSSPKWDAKILRVFRRRSRSRRAGHLVLP